MKSEEFDNTIAQAKTILNRDYEWIQTRMIREETAPINRQWFLFLDIDFKEFYGIPYFKKSSLLRLRYQMTLMGAKD